MSTFISEIIINLIFAINTIRDEVLVKEFGTLYNQFYN